VLAEKVYFYIIFIFFIIFYLGLFGFIISMAANLIMSYVAVGDSYKKGNEVDGKIYIDNIFLYFDQLGQERNLIIAFSKNLEKF
jgi:hypothetical protein